MCSESVFACCSAKEPVRTRTYLPLQNATALCCPLTAAAPTVCSVLPHPVLQRQGAGAQPRVPAAARRRRRAALPGRVGRARLCERARHAVQARSAAGPSGNGRCASSCGQQAQRGAAARPPAAALPRHAGCLGPRARGWATPRLLLPMPRLAAAPLSLFCRCQVEYAAYQKVPRSRVKRDPKEGSLDRGGGGGQAGRRGRGAWERAWDQARCGRSVACPALRPAAPQLATLAAAGCFHDCCTLHF